MNAGTDALRQVTLDGNEATAYVAYRTNEVIAIYPITPSSTMGELADQWASEGLHNLWGQVPTVQEMQSEAGAAGAIHGALQAGALSTTFTASQGLLLMIPNMYKIAGELTPAVFHIAARTVATHALSIFGDHSDVMAARATGWAMLFANSVQEAHDFALISQAATLRSRVPFLHVFDGFRTSHEVQKITRLSNAQIRGMIDEDLVRAHKARALNPNHPTIRGTAQNPDVYFQGREAANPYYAATPGIVQDEMERFAELTGRRYRLVEYVGPHDADVALVAMGSAAETIEECLPELHARGHRVGLLKIRLYRPFPTEALLRALPRSVTHVAVLDRTKEPGSEGEPLFLDVLAAVAMNAHRRPMPRVVGGRYGLSSKEFTPPMVRAIVRDLVDGNLNHGFTVGILDDVSHTSLTLEPGDMAEEPEDTFKGVFWGLGSDGTVGANKASIKILGDLTPNYAQAYFVYDSKKSGSVTVSHLRVGPRPIKSAYLVQSADFVGVHQFGLLERYPVLECAARGATVLLNAPLPPDRIWNELPRAAQEVILKRDLRVFTIDAYAIARRHGLKGRINTVMQAAFFQLSQVMALEPAVEAIKNSITKSYAKAGPKIVAANLVAVDEALSQIHRVDYPREITSVKPLRAHASDSENAVVMAVLEPIMESRGDAIPVSALPADGTYPSGTARLEKRRIGVEAPAWDTSLCIQCGKCVMVCPHAVIRSKIVSPDQLAGAPEGYATMPAKWREAKESLYTLQVSLDDCTGCALCVDVCPARDKQDPSRLALTMKPTEDLREELDGQWEFFEKLPDTPAFTEPVRFNSVKNLQVLRPLFEFSGACSGCGETPYLKLLTQLYGDRSVIANATGCSSIYGANLPTTPWSCNAEGRGPAWANSLFEDNAEFGFGMRLALDAKHEEARALLGHLKADLPLDLVQELTAKAGDRDEVDRKRHAIARLKSLLVMSAEPTAQRLLELADGLLETTVWIIGGDGWAYDIGFGGLDHVLSSGRNVNLLVMDTEVYSNTGGQASKSTARGASARFAMAGKSRPKKDLGLMMMSYGTAYVAQVAMGASDAQLLKAVTEAASFDGPSLIIAYGHCIAHGIDMTQGLKHQRLAVETGYWPLYRFDPRLTEEGKNPFQLDSRRASRPLREFLETESRFAQMLKVGNSHAEELLALAQHDVEERWRKYEALANLSPISETASA